MAVNGKTPYCAAMVRRFDRDRYLCTLFAPASRRDALLALYAFNLEIARIPELVREPILGSVRLQWWRDTIGAIYAGNPPAHEVAAALARAVAEHALSREHFERLLDAREFDLGDAPPEDIPALIAYADATAGNLTALALEILGSGGGAAEAAGRDAGVAWALTGLLRAAAFHASRGRIFFPRSLLERHGVETSDILALRSSAPLRAATEEIAALAQDRLAEARSRDVPEWAIPALLPAVLAQSYLSRLARSDFDPFTSALERGSIARQLRLWLAARRGRI